jgi:Sec-independent protein secretion pathway component TatC
MYSSQESQMTIAGHFSELYNIFRFSTFGVIFLSFFMSFFIEDLIKYWLDHLALDNTLVSLSVYSPYDWINIKWTILLIFSITTVLPITSLKLRSFALPGLYPKEQRWLSFVLLFSAFFTPLLILSLWFIAIPFSLTFFVDFGVVDGVTAKYDAASLIYLGIGISWILIIGVLTIIVLSLSRIFGIVEGQDSKIRIRILLIGFSLIFLTLPETYDGLRLIIAFFTIFSADYLSRMTPIFE